MKVHYNDPMANTYTSDLWRKYRNAELGSTRAYTLHGLLQRRGLLDPDFATAEELAAMDKKEGKE